MKRRNLSFNRQFNIHALFADIDSDKNGYLTIAELEKWASAFFSSGMNWEGMARLWNNGADGDSESQRVYFDEFSIGLTGGLPPAFPTRIINRYGYPEDVRFTDDDSVALKRSYVSDSFVAVLEEINNLVSIEPPLVAPMAEKLWNKLSLMHGQLPIELVGQWLFDASGFNAPLPELDALFNASGMISKEQFLQRIAVEADYVQTSDEDEQESAAPKADRSKVKKMFKAVSDRLTKTQVLKKIQKADYEALKKSSKPTQQQSLVIEALMLILNNKEQDEPWKQFKQIYQSQLAKKCSMKIYTD